MFWRMLITKAVVLPIPDCICAMISQNSIIGPIVRCWIAEGFSTQCAQIPRRRLSCSFISSNVSQIIVDLSVSSTLPWVETETPCLPIFSEYLMVDCDVLEWMIGCKLLAKQQCDMACATLHSRNIQYIRLLAWCFHGSSLRDVDTWLTLIYISVAASVRNDFVFPRARVLAAVSSKLDRLPGSISASGVSVSRFWGCFAVKQTLLFSSSMLFYCLTNESLYWANVEWARAVTRLKWVSVPNSRGNCFGFCLANCYFYNAPKLSQRA